MLIRPAVLVVCLLLSSCRCDTDPPPAPIPGEAPAAEKPTVHPLAQRICDAVWRSEQRRRTCCGKPGGNAPLAAQCVSGLTEALNRGWMTATEGAVAQCEADSAAATDGCDWVGPLRAAAPKSCRTLYAGARADGESCHSTLECGAGLYCRGATTDGAGVCAPQQSDGGDCSLPTDALGAFLRLETSDVPSECKGVCVKGQCVDRRPEGGKCPSNAVCLDGLACIDGACRAAPPGDVGQPCVARRCVEGARCLGGVCAVLEAAGAECTSHLECRAGCVRAPGQKTGRCGMVCRAGTGIAHRPVGKRPKTVPDPLRKRSNP